MDTATRPGFGTLLRRWRRQRGRSQLALALDAAISARHVSRLEGDKVQPSRAMVLRLAACLDVPLRERDALLQAAGFAPLFAGRGLAHPALALARETLDRLLAAYEPWPALVVDRHWTLVQANRAVAPLLGGLPATLLQPPVNVLRLSLHPRGLAPQIENLPAWREHLLARLQRQCAATADPQLHALHTELAGLPMPVAGACGPPGLSSASDAGAPSAAPVTRLAAAESTSPSQPAIVPLVLNGPHGRLSFITTVTVFGAPHEALLAELAIETLLPADPGTAEALRRLAGTTPG
jgi:transcriptional regulator with XRE-family HTH domain